MQATDPGETRHRVVIVEDDRSLREMLVAVLAGHGYDATAHPDAEALIAVGLDERDALLVLDVGLPGMDGLDLCARLRRDRVVVPILMLTARHDTPDRVAGLDAGADDYLVKPFALDELLARVRALVRRGTDLGSSSSQPASAERRVGDLVIDHDLRAAWRGETELALTQREFDLLWFLVGRSPSVVTRELLHEHVWGTDAEFMSNSLEVFVSQLRRKTEVGGAGRLIHTVRGVGYTVRTEAERAGA